MNKKPNVMRFAISILILLFFNSILFSQAKIIQEHTEKWDLGVAKWQNKTLTNYHYDTNDSLTLRELYIWNIETNEWELSKSTSFFYNSDLNEKIQIDSIFGEGSNPDLTYVLTKNVFNEFGLITYDSIYHGEYFGNVLSFDTIFLEKSQYDSNQQLTLFERFSGRNEMLIKRVTFVKQYDLNGCLTEDLREVFSNSQSIIFQYLHENFPDCRKSSTLQRVSWIQPDTLIDYTRHFYSYYGNGFLSSDLREVKYSTSSDWQLSRKKEYFYDSEERLIQKYDFFAVLNREEIFQYFFDDFGNSNSYRYYNRYNPNESFELKERDTSIFVFDDKNRIIKKSTSFFAPNLVKTILYDSIFYCDDFIKMSKIENLKENIIERTHYFYEELSNCVENSEKQNLKTFPNPTTGILKINSNLLSAQNHQVNIYTSDGRFLRTQSVDFRTEEMTLDLSDLSNGIYFIEVRNEGGRLTEKVIISK